MMEQARSSSPAGQLPAEPTPALPTPQAEPASHAVAAPAVDVPPRADPAAAPAKGPAPGELVGRQRHRVVPFPVKLLQVVTGYLLLRWVVVLAARHLAGLVTESRLRHDGRHLRLVSTTRLLGREVRRTEEVLLRADLVCLGVERRFPQLPLLAGAAGVLLGAIYGLGFVIDGIEASYLPLAIFGLGVLLAGVLLDIGIGALADHVGSRTSLLVTIRRGGWLGLGRRLRITGVSEEAARAFVERASGGAPE